MAAALAIMIFGVATIVFAFLQMFVINKRKPIILFAIVWLIFAVYIIAAFWSPDLKFGPEPKSTQLFWLSVGIFSSMYLPAVTGAIFGTLVQRILARVLIFWKHKLLR
jgi:uncharacterized membrane protein (DUF4010 family)